MMIVLRCNGRGRARAGGQAVAVATTTGVRVNAYAAAAAACLRARKWTTTTTSERASEQAKSGKESVGESHERREVAGDSPRNSAALSSATHCNSTRMHAHDVHDSRLCVPKKRFKGK